MASASHRDESEETEDEPGSGEETKAASSGYSAALTESLTMYKTAAMAAELSRNPEIALAAMAHALVLSQFRLDLGLYRSQTCVQLSTSQPHLAAASDSAAIASLEAQKQHWLSLLSRNEDELWTWFLAQPLDVLLRLVAFCVAQSINTVQAKHETHDHQRLQHGNALGAALRIDMFAAALADFRSASRIFTAR